MRTLLAIILLSSTIMGVCQGSYFQQTVNTTIEVTLDDKRHVLSAFEKIEYINNSPDNLDTIILHIWPNAYRDNMSAMATQLDENGEVDFHFADSIDRGFIDSLDFKVNGVAIEYSYYNNQPDIIYLLLKETLESGEKLLIETPFRVKIPKGIYSRLGHIGQSYQITQWFPKPAVYDREGWHPIPYLSQGEFYSEYGTYDVKITLPKNYVLGATGDLVNGEEELAFLDEIVKKTEELAVSGNYPRNKAGMPLMSFPVSSQEMKTLHFHQENVHDFAWFADKRYHVLKGSVELPHTKRTVTTWAMFTNNEFDLWKNSIEYLNDATYYYSLWVGDYPYNHVTAVDGSISAGGGMEYPNITVIGESYTDFSLEQVIVHEVGHNWFYGLLGSNERVNAWMDEGLNTFTENRYTETKYPEMKMEFGLPEKLMKKAGLDDYGPRGMYDLGYMFNARRNYDQPIQTSSELFTPTNYGAIVYGKTGIGFDYLLAYLGEDVFNKCMRAYFEEWHFKHPQPDDVRAIFEKESGKDLSWLFEDFIKTNRKIDYKLSKVKEVGDSLQITVKNKEKIAAPFSLYGLEQGVITSTQWFEGFENKTVVTVPLGADLVQMDVKKDMPTINRQDDRIKTSGVCKTCNPVKLKFLGSFEKPGESHIYYTPVLGWNAQDRGMFGIAMYNTVVPEKKLEWLVMPMYGVKSKQPVGVGDLKYHFYGEEGIIRKLTLGFTFKSYSTKNTADVWFFNGQNFSEITTVSETSPWYRNQLSLDFELNNHNLRKAKHNLLVRAINIVEDVSLFDTDVTNALNFTYTVKNRQVLKPASLRFDVVGLNSMIYGTFTGVSMEAKIRKNYNVSLKGFELRFFAGQTLYRDGLTTSKYNWSLTGQRGVNDYLFDNVLLGRSSDFPDMTAQQSTSTHGDFKVNTLFNIGSNDSWVASLNLKVEAPFRFLGVFADVGMYPVTTISNGQSSTSARLDYDAGIYIPIRKDVFEIYLPLIYSEGIKDQIDYYNITFMQRIRFVLNLNELNPFKIVKNINP